MNEKNHMPNLRKIPSTSLVIWVISGLYLLPMVWFLLSTTVGERAIVGANSVVTTDVAPYSIVAGAPARVIKSDWRLPGVGDVEVPTSS